MIIRNARTPWEVVADSVGGRKAVISVEFQVVGRKNTRSNAPVANGYSTRYGVIVNCSCTNMTESRLWSIYQAINDWVKFADAKAGVALAAQGAVFTIAVPAIITNRSYFLAHSTLVLGVLIATLAGAVSVFFGVRAIIPRLSVGEAKSLIFFAHIAKAYSDFESFRSHSKGHYNDDEGFNNQILDQIWANSQVAWAKHKNSAFCLWALVAEAVIATALFLFSLFFI